MNVAFIIHPDEVLLCFCYIDIIVSKFIFIFRISRATNPTPMQQLPSYAAGNTGVNSQPKNQQARGNVAAVEPYNHVPHAQSVSHNANFQVIITKNTVLECIDCFYMQFIKTAVTSW